MRTSADQQDPHSCGIDESGAGNAQGGGDDEGRRTPPGISHLPTDDVLATAGTLPMGSSTEGMTPQVLGSTPQSAFEVGSEKFAFPEEGGAVDPRAYPVSDFMRPEAARKGSRTGGF